MRFLGLLEEFKYFFSMPSVWVAFGLLVFGTTLVILARRIARVIRKTNTIENNDKYMITFKCFGVVLMFLGVLIIAFI